MAPSSETVASVSRSLRRRFSMMPPEDFLGLGANYSLRINRTISCGRIRGQLSANSDKRLHLGWCCADPPATLEHAYGATAGARAPTAVGTPFGGSNGAVHSLGVP